LETKYLNQDIHQLDTMKKKLIAAFCIVLIIISVIAYLTYIKNFSSVPTSRFDTVAYKNYLDYTLTQTLNNASDQTQLMSFLVMSYSALQLPYPVDKQLIVDYFNSRQLENGTWIGVGPHNEHWAPNTATNLMCLDLLGAQPAKSLDPYYTATNTWAKTYSLIQEDEHWGGFWGESWGHVEIWVVNKKQSPPWAEQWYSYSVQNFNDWISNNHQTTHFISAAYSLNLEIPQKDQVIATLLDTQDSAGSWTGEATETSTTIMMLNLLQASGQQVTTAINKAIDYLLSGASYKGWYQNREQFVAFIRKGEPYPDPNVVIALILDGVISGNPNVWNYHL
jgi:hypothetical protein